MPRVQKSNAAAHSTASGGTALMSSMKCMVSRKTSEENEKKKRHLQNNR